MRLSRHLLIDGWGCAAAQLDDPEQVQAALRRSVQDSAATLIDLCVHQFSPQGVTATATLAESHLAIHTWPEHGYFAADLLFCGELDPQRGVPAIVESLAPARYRVREIPRGIALPLADANRLAGEIEEEGSRTKDDGS
ncbi:MAG: adenosylmethionine decarboxylase [Planctomycetota bacterium]|nr:MAG: adenosylmethionine decarboxylase [Planctomycetota bacterium]